MPFLRGDVVVRETSDTEWELVEPLVYRGNRQTFIIDVGCTTDFASVPRQLVWLIPKYGSYTKAAILHDYLWRTGVVSRADANGIFRRALRELEVSAVRRWMMWGAVGLASAIKDPRGELKPGPMHVVGLVLVDVPAIVFVAVPFVVVSAWLLGFYVIENLGWPIDWLLNALKPEERREQVNRPKLLWRLA